MTNKYEVLEFELEFRYKIQTLIFEVYDRPTITKLYMVLQKDPKIQTLIDSVVAGIRY